MTAAVRVQSVSKSFRALRALREVSLEVQPGEFIGLLGPNGAGKTTLISTLAGLVRADSGSVSIMGKDVVRELLKLKAPQMTIVSCNPSTLARDLEELKSAYDIAELSLIDLFPPTYHLETIAKLKLKA